MNDKANRSKFYYDECSWGMPLYGIAFYRLVENLRDLISRNSLSKTPIPQERELLLTDLSLAKKQHGEKIIVEQFMPLRT